MVGHDVVLQGTKCRDVSWHQVTGVHNIDNYVVLGEHWGGPQCLHGLLGSLVSPLGPAPRDQAAVVAGVSGVHTLGYRGQLQVLV